MRLFKRPAARLTIAILDIDSGSVGGGLLHVTDGKQPVMCYTTRETIDAHDAPGNDALTERMLRALTAVTKRLIVEGAPHLRACAGSGTIDRVIVSLAAPWQSSTVETQVIQKDQPFTYTKALERETLAALPIPDSAHLQTRDVIATILNGYATRNPYNNRVTKAEIISLVSLLDASVVDAVDARIRKHFHTRDIGYTGFAAPTYSAIRELCPHEKDMLVISVMGEGTDIASVKRDHLVDVGSFPKGSNALAHEGEATGWFIGLTELLRTFAKRHALPRLVFLLVDESLCSPVRKQLEDPSLLALWLSDTPLTIIPVLPKQFTPFIKTVGGASGDSALGILALYARAAGSGR